MLKVLTEEEAREHDQRAWAKLKTGDLITFNVESELDDSLRRQTWAPIPIHHAIVFARSGDTLIVRDLNKTNRLLIAQGSGISLDQYQQQEIRTINILVA